MFATAIIPTAIILGSLLTQTPPTPPASPAPPATPPAGPTAQQPARAPQPPAAAKPKSLDDLLGTSTGKPTSPATPPSSSSQKPGAAGEREGALPADPVAEQREGALKKVLSEQELGEAFQQAVAQMARGATLLEERLDSGLDTQRVQEDVLAKLDLLLKQPPKKGKSSSSSSSKQREQQQQQMPGQQQSGQKPKAGDRAQQPAQDSNPEAGAAQRQEAALEQALEAAGAEWGNLPDRVRDMIRQGLRDRASSLYQRLTEDYYRRLAEEAK